MLKYELSNVVIRFERNLSMKGVFFAGERKYCFNNFSQRMNVFTFWKMIAVAGIVQQYFRYYHAMVCVLHLLHLITYEWISCSKIFWQQECIPVGWVPAARWPYAWVCDGGSPQRNQKKKSKNFFKKKSRKKKKNNFWGGNATPMPPYHPLPTQDHTSQISHTPQE